MQDFAPEEDHLGYTWGAVVVRASALMSDVPRDTFHGAGVIKELSDTNCREKLVHAVLRWRVSFLPQGADPVVLFVDLLTTWGSRLASRR